VTTTIALTQGKIARVSEEDYDNLLSIGTWCYSKHEYAVHYARCEDGRRTTISMHRVIMARMLGHAIPNGLTVDHIDQNRTHNVRTNLRLATPTQQQSNRTFDETPTGLKGVTEEPSGRFRARLRYDYGRSLHLGIYDDPDFAGLLYDAAAQWFHADFASPNSETPIPLQVLTILRDHIQRSPEALAYLKRVGRPLLS
jgi:hypothetical protein